MELISREVFIAVLDALIRVGCALVVAYFLSNVYCSLRRGYVFIYGKVAKKEDEPLGYWFGIFCWIAASGILGYVVYRGL